VTQATPSVGPDYGLEPIQDRTLIVPPLTSRNLVSPDHYSEGSEFGGVPGMIQPPPHVPTASERLRMIYALDPMDDGTRPDSVAVPDLTGDF